MDAHRVYVQISGDFAVPFPRAWFRVSQWLAQHGPPELDQVCVVASCPEGVRTLGLAATVGVGDEASAVRIASMALWNAIGGAGLLPAGAVLDV